MPGKSGLTLIETHCQQIEVDRSAPLEILQKCEQGKAVLPAAQADHNAIAFNDHIKIRNRLPDAPQEFSLKQLIRLLHLRFPVLQWEIVAQSESIPIKHDSVSRSSFVNRQS